MKSKDQQFLEEAYDAVKEGKYTTNYGMPKMKSKAMPLSDFDDSARQDFRNRERNAGVEETPTPFKSSSYKYKVGDVYEKHGRKFIIARSKYTGKLGPQHVEYVQGEDMEDGRYEVVYKITGVDSKGYPISEPTGEKRKLREPTQWGVKDVPGGDID